MFTGTELRTHLFGASTVYANLRQTIRLLTVNINIYSFTFLPHQLNSFTLLCFKTDNKTMNDIKQ